MVYYKVTVALDPAEVVVKSGMTANVDIITDRRTEALVIPRRGVITQDGRRYVRLLVDGAPVEAEVSVGLVGDDGEVEITEGLEAGDEVIIFEREAE